MAASFALSFTPRAKLKAAAEHQCSAPPSMKRRPVAAVEHPVELVTM